MIAADAAAAAVSKSPNVVVATYPSPPTFMTDKKLIAWIKWMDTYLGPHVMMGMIGARINNCDWLEGNGPLLQQIKVIVSVFS